MTQLENDIPENWVSTTIGAVCTAPQYGYTTKAASTGELHLLRTTDITSGRIDWDTVPFCSDDPDDPAKYLLEDGDIVVSRAGSVGVSHLVSSPRRSVFASYLIRFKPHIDRRFFKYFLESPAYWMSIADKKLGIAVPNVNATKLKSIALPLAPIEEQRRIVSKIDELFSELDKGVESLTTAREQLGVYRIAVLDHCLHSGRYDVSYQPLGELIGEIQQGWSPKCDPNTATEDGEWGVIKTTTVQPMRYLPDKCKPLPAELEPRPAIEIHDGDLLMTRKGPRPRTGVVCLVRGVRNKSMLCDTVYRFRADEAQVTPDYLEIALNSPRVVSEIDARKSGISESGISLNHGKIKSLQIPVIPRESQCRLVATVRQRFSLIERLDTELEAQLMRSRALRQSLLRRAYVGGLVSQDPADEPASVLLERIRTEQHTRRNGTMKRKART